MGLFKKVTTYYTPPGELLTPPNYFNELGDEPTPEHIAGLLAACGVPCTPVRYSTGASAIIYHFDLVDLSQFSSLSKHIPAVSARLRKQTVLSRSNIADFALTLERTERATVPISRVMYTSTFNGSESPTTAAIGLDMNNNAVVINLAKMPHILIAGATGSGKTVAAHTMITSMLYRGTPLGLKMVMIDPKQTELGIYNGIPHLLTPIITNTGEAISALDDICGLMDARYKEIAKTGKKYPALVVIVDELADLMLTSKSRVESSLIRLSQLGRACGIHLMVCTQQPRASVLTGLIRANIPARLALKCSTGIDSRICMERNGAEKLAGRGDAYFIDPADSANPIRLQVAYTSEQDTINTVNYWKSKDCKKPQPETS